LSVPENDCDIGRFALGNTAGAQAAAAGKFAQAGEALSAALAEWRGPVLEDLRDFQFVDAFATAHAEAEIACGRGYAVIGELESRSAEQPNRGRVLRQEPLDVKRVARTTAIHTGNSLDQRTAISVVGRRAALRHGR
jgi:hypothetical protein